MADTNLKRVLMELGNRLVTEYGYVPGKARTPTCTGAIIDFTEWLNNTPEAREILENMGFEWPVAERPKRDVSALREIGAQTDSLDRTR